MTSFTRKLYERSPRAAEDFHNAQKFEHRMVYGRHVTLAQFTPDHRPFPAQSQTQSGYGHRAGLAAPSFGKRLSPPVLPAYECWAPNLGKPKVIVRAVDSFAARQKFAAYHKLSVTEVFASRRELPRR